MNGTTKLGRREWVSPRPALCVTRLGLLFVEPSLPAGSSCGHHFKDSATPPLHFWPTCPAAPGCAAPRSRSRNRSRSPLLAANLTPAVRLFAPSCCFQRQTWQRQKHTLREVTDPDSEPHRASAINRAAKANYSSAQRGDARTNLRHPPRNTHKVGSVRRGCGEDFLLFEPRHEASLSARLCVIARTETWLPRPDHQPQKRLYRTRTALLCGVKPYLSIKPEGLSPSARRMVWVIRDSLLLHKMQEYLLWISHLSNRGCIQVFANVTRHNGVPQNTLAANGGYKCSKPMWKRSWRQQPTDDTWQFNRWLSENVDRGLLIRH